LTKVESFSRSLPKFLNFSCIKLLLEEFWGYLEGNFDNLSAKYPPKKWKTFPECQVKYKKGFSAGKFLTKRIKDPMDKWNAVFAALSEKFRQKTEIIWLNVR